jgi:hypothetical protein
MCQKVKPSQHTPGCFDADSISLETFFDTIDFDLSLRLQLSGYTSRWATYSNGEFKEGVSLTVVDEM